MLTKKEIQSLARAELRKLKTQYHELGEQQWVKIGPQSQRVRRLEAILKNI